MRYVVDERIGCVGIKEIDKVNPDENGLSPDIDGVVFFRMGEKEYQGTDGFNDYSWKVDQDLLEICHQVCAMLNELGYEETRKLLPYYDGWTDG